jgi:hypothetical protein
MVRSCSVVDFKKFSLASYALPCVLPSDKCSTCELTPADLEWPLDARCAQGVRKAAQALQRGPLPPVLCDAASTWNRVITRGMRDCSKPSGYVLLCRRTYVLPAGTVPSAAAWLPSAGARVAASSGRFAVSADWRSKRTREVRCRAPLAAHPPSLTFFPFLFHLNLPFDQKLAFRLNPSVTFAVRYPSGLLMGAPMKKS